MNEIKDYILLKLGAPVIAIDLTDEELDFCIKKSREVCGDTSETRNFVQEGAVDLARYILAKKKFNRFLTSTMVTPDDDGFAEMVQADSDWDDFVYSAKDGFSKY